jgi:MYXO-CTERM domain-containing protein
VEEQAMRSKQLLRGVVFGAVLAFSAASGRVAHAEADTFGIGDGHSGPKTIAGDEIVNAYAPVAENVSAGATQIAIGNIIGTGTFGANDLVLIWRATGVDSTAPGVASGNQNALVLKDVENSDVGRWELARVATIVGSTITLTKPVAAAWKKNVTQIVRVPEYTTLTVPTGTSIKPAIWQAVGAGFAGGIIAVFANNTVSVVGKIDGDASGFRGGVKVQRTNVLLDCQNNDGTVEQGYAPKGESVVGTKNAGGDFTGQVFGEGVGGKGNRSIGAGGGNCVENGGGGGGNFGTGGKGGESILSGVSGTNRGGLGGAAINYPLADSTIVDDKSYSRITMGGGGGAGEQKNGVGSSGGHGGGVVFLRANALLGTGSISANGESALNATLINTGLESDGAGGGGAGGSVLVRVVTTATCGGIEVKGGKGGDSQVVGASAWGPGGGGAGGRALLQSDSGGTCPISATPGAAGVSGAQGPRNATAGGDGNGTAVPPEVGGLCTNNNAPSQCANPNPSCDVLRGFCTKCDGPFGSTDPLACPTDVAPICEPDGTCKGCQRDLNVAGAGACQTSANPYCETTGADTGKCTKCTDDTDCVGATHPGPKCQPAAGACGKQCASDADCDGNSWCYQQVCIPKTPNAQPVPNLAPDTNGECTPAVGQRVCVSAVCEESDDQCGLKNGSPCNEQKPEQCRSTICFPTDDLCGKPVGEPCTGDGECRSDDCNNGFCTGCDEDSDCAAGKICDKPKKECVDGCRPGAQATDGGVNKGLCKPGEECVPRDGSDIGDCRPTTDAGAGDGGTGGDAGDTFGAGLVEGGGCSCRTSVAAASPPFALFAAVAAGFLAVRRRRNGR